MRKRIKRPEYDRDFTNIVAAAAKIRGMKLSEFTRRIASEPDSPIMKQILQREDVKKKKQKSFFGPV